MNKFYKILTVDEDNNKWSWLAKEEWAMKYEEDKWIQATIGKLFIFDNIGHAIEALGVCQPLWNIEIWAVEAINPEYAQYCAIRSVDASSWWNCYEYSKFEGAMSQISIAPFGPNYQLAFEGTMIVPQLKLVNVVGGIKRKTWAQDLKKLRKLYNE